MLVDDESTTVTTRWHYVLQVYTPIGTPPLCEWNRMKAFVSPKRNVAQTTHNMACDVKIFYVDDAIETRRQKNIVLQVGD